MKKSKILVVIFTILLICCLSFVLVACGGNSDNGSNNNGGGNNNNGGTDNNGNAENGGNNPPSTHTHTWSETYSSDAINHWFACSGCDKKNNVQNHTFEQKSNEIGIFQECSTCKFVIDIVEYTKSLKYALNSDNTSYSVIGIENKDITKIVIPNTYQISP